jgi:hypothetical protein
MKRLGLSHGMSGVLAFIAFHNISSRMARENAMSIVLSTLERIRKAELMELDRLAPLNDGITEEEMECECSADCLIEAIENLRSVY